VKHGTVIAGVVTKRGLYMACDSSANYEDGVIYTDTEDKIFKLGPLLVGSAGSCRVAQILWSLGGSIPELKAEAPRDDLVRWVVPFLRRTLLTSGVDMKEPDFDLLVGYRGQLFTIDDDFHVGQDNLPFAAIGSGGETAWGVLYSHHKTGKLKQAPKKCLHEAMEAAAVRMSSVRGPFKVFKLEEKDA